MYVLICRRASQPIQEEEVEQFSRRLDPNRRNTTAVWQNTVAMISTTPRLSEAMAEDGDILVCGRVRLDHCPARTDSNGRAMLHDVDCFRIYVSNHEGRINADMMRECRGDYSLVIVDRRRSRIIVVRDPFGVMPLYYRMLGELMIFSDRASLLTDDLTDYDEEYLWRFVDGHDVGGGSQTAWRNVYAVPPGQILTFRQKGTTAEQFWSPEQYYETVSGKPASLAADMRDLLFQSVSKHLRGPSKAAWCLLSGGIDSSSVSCVASRLSQPAVSTALTGLVTYVDLVGDNETAFRRPLLMRPVFR